MTHNIHLQIDSFPLLSSFPLRYSRTRAHSLPGSDMPIKPPYRLSHGAAVFCVIVPESAAFYPHPVLLPNRLPAKYCPQ